VKEADQKPRQLENTEELGDLLKRGPALIGSHRTAASRLSYADAEDIIAGLARIHGIDPAAAVTEFRSKSALAELARAVFGVADDRPETFWVAVDMVEQVRAEGKRGVAAYEEAASRLNAMLDAAGQRMHSVSSASLETYWKEAKALLRSQRLLSLFVDNLPRPRRRANKG
jgi:hypothetical protein